MPDMLVKLLKLPPMDETELNKRGIVICRAMTPDKFRIVPWVREHSSLSASGECDACFARQPVSCFIATRGADIVGYACYDATMRDFFGPTAVLPKERGAGVGRALLLRCLNAMREEGYAYAIIGGVGPVEFYRKTVGATVIPDSDPGVYEDFLGRLEEE